METSKINNIESTLNYLDKIHASLLEIGQAINRSFLLTTLFSCIMITFSVGIVNINQNFSFAGFSLSIPSWFILFGGSILISTQFFHTFSLILSEDIYTEKITKIYTQILTDVEIDDTFHDTISFPYALNVYDLLYLRSKKRGKVFPFIVFSIIFWMTVILPIVSELLALIKTINLIGWIWWIIIIYILIIVLSIGAVIYYIRVSNSPHSAPAEGEVDLS